MTPSKIWKITIWTIGILFLIFAGFVIYLTGFRLRVKSEDITVEVTPASTHEIF